VQKRSISKLLGAAVLAGSLALSLAACTSSTTASGCTPTASGSASDSVKVSGKFGAKPKVSGTKGLKAKTTERTVSIAGKSSVASSGSTVTLNYTVYNGTTGKVINTTGYGKSKQISATLDKTLIPGLRKAVACSTAGSRVVAVIPPADAFGSAGQSTLGIKAKDSIVFVLDVDTVKLPSKTAVLNAPDSTFPKVTFDAKGIPTIAKPTGTQPTKLKVAYLSKGKGKTVKTGDSVTVNYTGIVWKTGTVFDSSWTRGTPATFITSQVVAGFGKALVGQAVGSKVIVIIPPAEGYGAGGNSQAGIGGTDDIVFVVQIISTKAS
jgi:FKBP-type peptidyl-prolyl cis-trans isomerase